MIKMISMWLMLSAAIAFGIMAFRQMTGKEQWQLTKLLAYATMCSLVAAMIIMAAVVAF